MKKKTRIIAIILAIVTVVSMIAPMVVNAEPADTQTETSQVQEETVAPDEIGAEDTEVTMPEETQEATDAVVEDTKKEEEKVEEPVVGGALTTGPVVEDDNNTDYEAWDGLCDVKVKLPTEVTEKTDNIVIQFTPAKSLVAAGKVTLSRENNFEAEVRLQPGEYKISFVSADNQYEVILKENRVEVPEARGAELTVNAKKIQDGSFFASFLRDNSFLLILLAGCSIALGVIKYRKSREYN
jgi:hypothetical protein